MQSLSKILCATFLVVGLSSCSILRPTAASGCSCNRTAVPEPQLGPLPSVTLVKPSDPGAIVCFDDKAAGTVLERDNAIRAYIQKLRASLQACNDQR